MALQKQFRDPATGEARMMVVGAGNGLEVWDATAATKLADIGGAATVARQIFKAAPLTTSSASATWVDKISQTITAFPSDTPCMIDVFYMWDYGNVSTDFTAQLLIDGVSVAGSLSDGLIHRAEPDDSGGTAVDGSASDQHYPFHMRYFHTFTAGTTPEIKLSFRPSLNGTQCSMWNASVSIEPE